MQNPWIFLLFLGLTGLTACIKPEAIAIPEANPEAKGATATGEAGAASQSDNRAAGSSTPQGKTDSETKTSSSVVPQGSADAGGTVSSTPGTTHTPQTETGAADTLTPSNLALQKPVTATAPCVAAEGAENAVDGSLLTKWCSPNNIQRAFLDIDLGSPQALTSVSILHAGAGGESVDYNTADYEILTASSATGPWSQAVAIKANKSSSTVHALSVTARYVRLHISQAGSDDIARIYEIAVE